MRIQKNEMIAGVPVLKVRDFFRLLYDGTMTKQELMIRFGLSEEETNKLIDELISEGYIGITDNQQYHLFKQNLQSALDCLRFYTPVILSNGLMTEPELNEMFDLFSPSSEEIQQLFSGQLILNAEVMERWLPKLEDLNNRVGILYIYLFDILMKG